MRILFFCQSVAVNDPIVGDTIDRVKALARVEGVDHITVLSVRGNDDQIDGSIPVFSLKRDQSGGFKALFRFFFLTLQIFKNQKIDVCYLYMTPTLGFLFTLLKILYPFKLVIWFAHTKFTYWTKINLENFCDRWFSVDRAQTLPFSHVRIIGQGVSLDHFQVHASEKKYDLVTVGRITPSKNLELMIEGVALAKKTKPEISLLICGDAYLEEDIYYKNELIRIIQEFDLVKNIVWSGMISRGDLPAKMREARFFIFTVPGGIGKATIEAMALGLPLIIAYPEAKNFLGEELGLLYTCEARPQEVCEKILSFMQMSLSEYEILSVKTASFARTECSLESFSERLYRALKT